MYTPIAALRESGNITCMMPASGWHSDALLRHPRALRLNSNFQGDSGCSSHRFGHLQTYQWHISLMRTQGMHFSKCGLGASQNGLCVLLSRDAFVLPQCMRASAMQKMLSICTAADTRFVTHSTIFVLTGSSSLHMLQCYMCLTSDTDTSAHTRTVPSFQRANGEWQFPV